MKIFEFIEYKKFVNSVIHDMPGHGRGVYRQIAEHLRISTTMVSQVFKGDKELSLEHASELADFFHLSDEEAEYLVLLVQTARAGSVKLRERLEKQIRERRKAALKLDQRIKKDAEISESSKLLFYSNWMYSGIRNLVGIPAMKDIKVLAHRLNLPITQVQKVVDFLLKEGMLVEGSKGLEVGPRRTHIGSDSPFVTRHHQNWRVVGFQKMTLPAADDFFYTGPMSLSAELAEQIRAELPKLIEELYRRVGPSESEVVRCLNIDWFEY